MELTPREYDKFLGDISNTTRQTAEGANEEIQESVTDQIKQVRKVSNQLDDVDESLTEKMMEARIKLKQISDSVVAKERWGISIDDIVKSLTSVKDTVDRVVFDIKDFPIAEDVDEIRDTSNIVRSTTKFTKLAVLDLARDFKKQEDMWFANLAAIKMALFNRIGLLMHTIDIKYGGLWKFFKKLIFLTITGGLVAFLWPIVEPIITAALATVAVIWTKIIKPIWVKFLYPQLKRFLSWAWNKALPAMIQWLMRNPRVIVGMLVGAFVALLPLLLPLIITKLIVFFTGATFLNAMWGLFALGLGPTLVAVAVIYGIIQGIWGFFNPEKFLGTLEHIGFWERVLGFLTGISVGIIKALTAIFIKLPLLVLTAIWDKLIGFFQDMGLDELLPFLEGVEHVLFALKEGVTTLVDWIVGAFKIKEMGAILDFWKGLFTGRVVGKSLSQIREEEEREIERRKREKGTLPGIWGKTAKEYGIKGVPAGITRGWETAQIGIGVVKKDIEDGFSTTNNKVDKIIFRLNDLVREVSKNKSTTLTKMSTVGFTPLTNTGS